MELRQSRDSQIVAANNTLLQSSKKKLKIAGEIESKKARGPPKEKRQVKR